MYIFLDTRVHPFTKSWIQLYSDLFRTQSTSQIILTLNRIMRRSRKSGMQIFEVSQKIFKRATNVLELKYGEFQRIRLGKGQNESGVDLQLMNKLTTKGIY